MNKRKRTFLRSAVLGVTAIATSLTIGMSAACSKSNDGSSSSDKEDEKTTTKIDEQTIKNGNFEFYSDNKGLYPISKPDSWTSGYSGSSSSSMSGVINTSKERWDYITNPDLAKILEDNDDLESGDENKKDYNGALQDDLPYKNTHDAIKSDATDEQKEYIENPFTHEYSYNEDGKILDAEGNEVTTYEDEDGKLYLDDKLTKPLDTSVLMIHNYRRNDFHGTETYYNSNTTISLEANTAAEISLWVKTTEMYFSGANTKRTKVEFDHGAYIKVNTEVGGNSLDAFQIKNIDTEKLNPDGKNNGWVQYTVYVAASSFATTTVSLTLGLGENEAGSVEGYAFFDDVTITKYLTKAEIEGKFDGNIRENATDEKDENVCRPLAPKAKTQFRVDVEKRWTNNDEGGLEEAITNHNFGDTYFYIDFTSTTTYEGDGAVPLGTDNVTAGLTVEDTNSGKYVCTRFTEDNKYKTNGLEGLGTSDEDTYLPTSLRNTTINLKNDVLATLQVGENFEFTSVTTEYKDILTDALSTATKLPDAGANTDALVMLSALGASYEAHITDESFTLDDGQHKLVSFWIKTSDMKGNTAATVTVKGVGDDDKDNISSFTVDSTAISKVNIDKAEDVYKGWVRCFVRVANTSKVDGKQFEIVVNFGTTSIRNASRSSFKAGWVAVTNMSVMTLDEDVYGYTSGSAQTATLSFTETETKTSHRFDTEQGEKNEIKTDLATPSSYKGVNGNSKFVKPDTTVSLDGYHDANKNDYAGLLNKDSFATYANRYATNHDDCMWYNALNTIAGTFNTSDELWNEVFDKHTVQPLLIVNSLRQFGEEAAKRYNYGHIYTGSDTSVSANGYKAVSVRVKASAGAVANIYLVENKEGGEVLSYTTPKYNYWYDSKGNILKGQPDKDATAAEKKANIAYTLRKDGLYENGDGKLYANFHNLTRHYDESFEHEDFYDEDGNLLVYSSKNISDDKVYYANAQKTKYAPHYLIAGGKANNKVYLYRDGLDENATYYYVEKGKANKDKVVYGLDTTGATAALRYDVSDEPLSSPYQFTIDTVANTEYANKWITVTFYIHAGSASKSYKLELWSGARDVESSYTESGYNKDSYVIFDYSNLGASLDQSTYDGLVEYYTTGITEEYKKVITADLDKELEDNDANISELEKIAGEKVGLYGYEAAYYTFSLYDSAAFIPFNGETTEGTGYSFDYSESKESLAFLKVVDDGLPYGTADKTDADYTLSAFIDYSVIDKDIKILNEPTASGTSSSDSDTTTQSDNKSNVWLLASSIVLIVAIFVAIAAIFIRDFVRKHKGKKTSGKNTYNFNKNKRYVKKYVKANGEAPVIEEGEFDETLMTDKPDGATAANTEAETQETTDGATTANTEAETQETTDGATVANTEAETQETTDGATAANTEAETQETPAEDTVEEQPAESGEEKPSGDGKEE